jgi:enoyl-CoA hydratase/carnithine racemase
MSELVAVRTHGSACVISLEREAKLNAISGEMERLLCEAVESDAVARSRAVIFTGGPRVFSAGADLNEMRGLDPASIMASYRGTGDWVERIGALPVPTFSAISGYCMGGGFELVLATDFRIADPTAVFGLPEVALGILPSWGGTQRLVQLLGVPAAKELILLRGRVDATEALRLGLLTELVGKGEALERALALSERVASLPPLAVNVTREVIDAMSESSRSAGLMLERIAYGMLAQTAEADDALSGKGVR